MTAACLTLLRQSECPIWPWCRQTAGERGLLVEAFPAAQLCHWGMKFQKYDGEEPNACTIRKSLVDSLSEKIEIPEIALEKMKRSADALDAVVCAFAAIAVSTGRVAPMPSSTEPDDEGQIAVHNKDCF